MNNPFPLPGYDTWKLDGPAEGPEEIACRECGCTDSDCSQCIERTGAPCHWVEPDLCSACVEPKNRPREPEMDDSEPF